MAIQKSEDPAAFAAFEHEGWQTVNKGYDEHWGPVTRQTAEPTLDAAGVMARTKLLDVCTGSGILAAAALKRGADVTGLDFSDAFLAMALQNVPGAEFRHGDAQALPFEDESFDAVVCGYGVIHVPDPGKALAEMARVLKPGGRAAVSVWDAPTPDNGLGAVYGAIKAHGDLGVPLPHGPDFFQFSTPDTMTAALESAGLSGIETASVPQYWELADPASLIDALLESAVRVRALLLGQTDEVRQVIEKATAAAISRFEFDGTHYRMPMPALIGSGGK